MHRLLRAAESVDLLHGSIEKGLLLFALPLLISNLCQQFYNAVDTVIVGYVLGEEALAAVGACASVYELFVGFAQGVGNGFGVVAARFYGAGDETALRKSVFGSLLIGAALTAVMMPVGWFGLYPLLHLLGTPEEIIGMSRNYIVTIALGIGAMFAYNLLSGLLRAIGNSLLPLLFLVFSSLLNVVLDLVLITAAGMGVFGAALATVIAQGISALLCALYILLRVPELVPRRRELRVEGGILTELAGQGFSMGLMSAIVSSGSIILQSAINSLGTLTIAAHTAARKLFSLTLIPNMSICTAEITFVSQNRGAGQRERILRGMRSGMLMIALWSLLLTITMPFAGRTLIRLLTGSAEETVLTLGRRYLMLSSPFLSVLGVLIISRNSLQALGSKLMPLISSCIELAGKVLFTVLIIPRTGYTGVIFCEPVIWCAMTIQLVWALARNPFLRGKEASPPIQK